MTKRTLQMTVFWLVTLMTLFVLIFTETAVGGSRSEFAELSVSTSDGSPEIVYDFQDLTHLHALWF